MGSRGWDGQRGRKNWSEKVRARETVKDRGLCSQRERERDLWSQVMAGDIGKKTQWT